LVPVAIAYIPNQSLSEACLDVDQVEGHLIASDDEWVLFRVEARHWPEPSAVDVGWDRVIDPEKALTSDSVDHQIAWLPQGHKDAARHKLQSLENILLKTDHRVDLRQMQIALAIGFLRRHELHEVDAAKQHQHMSLVEGQ